MYLFNEGLFFQFTTILVCDWSLSGKELQFLLSHNGGKIFEVLRFKEETRSWFVEDSVQKGSECEERLNLTINNNNNQTCTVNMIMVTTDVRVYF